MTTILKSQDCPSPDAVNPDGPLFVLSVWRSGSSLLYTLLNQHSRIALLYEADIPHLHRFLWGRFRNGSWRERWEFWNHGPSRHGIAIDSLPANAGDAWQATRMVYQEFARRSQATVWGEKTPHWYDRPMSLADKFPDAGFIFLWRDMNAVLRSIASAGRTERFFRKGGFTEKVLIGNENLRKACDALKMRGRPVCEVNYEDLTRDPGQCMQLICNFLGIPFEERMASLEGADRSAIASGAHHSMVRSNLIMGDRKREELLTPALRAKIARYVCRWKQIYGGWPAYPVTAPAGTQPPSLLELWRDQIAYRAALGRDNFVAVIYAIVPPGVALGFRSWLRRRSRETKFTRSITATLVADSQTGQKLE